MKIIDAHSHYIPPDVAQNTTFFKMGWSDVDRHLKLMDECGIESSLLLYPTSDAHLKMGGWANVCKIYNQDIANVVGRFPSRFMGGAILPVDQPDLMTDELKRAQDLGLKVVSLASSYEGKYLDDEIFEGVFEFAQHSKIPVHVHPQIMNPIGTERLNDPLLSPVLEYVFDVSVCIGRMMMSGTFLKYPNVKFIFAHYGGVLPIVKERFDTTYAMLRGRNYVEDLQKVPSEYFKNLYFDVSGSRSLGTLLAALEVVDASHILFGSDFPANQNFKATMQNIQSAQLGLEEKNKIFSGNIFSMLNVDEKSLKS
ncbi:MAG: amidohydrolase [Candidatus Omnitrophica bacterium]|nr:amidohydrolase [Candidatus Omnitrophota bacterium]